MNGETIKLTIPPDAWEGYGSLAIRNGEKVIDDLNTVISEAGNDPRKLGHIQSIIHYMLTQEGHHAPVRAALAVGRDEIIRRYFPHLESAD